MKLVTRRGHLKPVESLARGHEVNGIGRQRGGFGGARNTFEVRVTAKKFKSIAGSAEATTLDRKSTRLNSSHANNSYAVFCLKKKKYQNSEGYVERHAC